MITISFALDDRAPSDLTKFLWSRDHSDEGSWFYLTPKGLITAYQMVHLDLNRRLTAFALESGKSERYNFIRNRPKKDSEPKSESKRHPGGNKPRKDKVTFNPFLSEFISRFEL